MKNAFAQGRVLAVLLLLLLTHAAAGQKWKPKVDKMAQSVDGKVVEWRHHIHQNPELSNQEKETAAYVAKHLESLGMEVRTGIARTGVVGILKGGKPGPVVALRADMDGLPVTERVELAWASTAKGVFNGEEVGVMHACGHDTHVAMLMGAAEILAGMKKDLKGTVVFIFQPAEEGSGPGVLGGAKMMVQEGVLEDPKVDVIFGLHINAQTEVGNITYRPGGIMAAADIWQMKIHGKQTHGSSPWTGVDPIVTGSMIIQGLQTIVSRQTELTKQAAVITVGKFHAGVRNNIIPEEAELVGTIRTLDPAMREILLEKVHITAEGIAKSQGATVDVQIDNQTPVTYNDPELTAMMVPTLQELAGAGNVEICQAMTGAEDFAFFQEKVPGFYFFLGGMPKGTNKEDAAPHHTPDFYVDDSGMPLGMRALCYLTLGYMDKQK